MKSNSGFWSIALLAASFLLPVTTVTAQTIDLSPPPGVTKSPDVVNPAVKNTGYSLKAGWNLVSNVSGAPLTVRSVFSGKAADNTTYRIISVWKFLSPLDNSGMTSWYFFAPNITSDTALATNATIVANGWRALTTIEPGEGFWVNVRDTSSTGNAADAMPYIVMPFDCKQATIYAASGVAGANPCP